MAFSRVAVFRLERAECLSDAISWLLKDWLLKALSPNMEMNEAFSPPELDRIAQNQPCDQLTVILLMFADSELVQGGSQRPSTTHYLHVVTPSILSS